MKRFLVLFSILFLGTYDLFAQTEPRTPTGSNVIFAELFGPGLSVSVNYDVRFNKTNKGLGMRIGLGGFKIDDTDLLAFPIGINYLLGRTDKCFEIGLTGVYSSTGFWVAEVDGQETEKVLGMLTMGFRRQPENSGFNFRVALNPTFGAYENGEIYFWPFYGGVSFGYSF